MMDPVVDDFAQRVSEFPLHTPQIPFISCVSGTWITDAEATDPTYWARHLRAAVQFSSGFRQLETMHPDGVLLEVGPGNTLISLGRQHSLAANGNSGATHTKLVASLGGSGASSNGDSEYAALLQAAGSLWAEGITLDWHALHSGEHRYRVSLPTYPFERKRFWLDSPPNNSALDSKSSALTPTDNFRPQFSVQETPQVQLLSQASSPGTLDSPATKISAAIAEIRPQRKSPQP
jgi:acyl transferase domain-containing protein